MPSYLRTLAAAILASVLLTVTLVAVGFHMGRETRVAAVR